MVLILALLRDLLGGEGFAGSMAARADPADELKAPAHDHDERDRAHVMSRLHRHEEIEFNFVESGSMKESSTPVWANGNGPSSLRQIQRREE